MGVDRLDNGDDPTRPADADPSKDADRSGEVPSSSDTGRAEDRAPDSSPRESPEDIANKQAEPRTRHEHADHIAPPGTAPTDGDPSNRKVEEAGYSQDEHREFTPAHSKESRSGGGPPLEGHQDKRQLEVPDTSSASDAKRVDSGNTFPGPTEEDDKTGSTSKENEQGPTTETTDPTSREAPDPYLNPDLEDGASDDAPYVGDEVRDSAGNEPSMEVADVPATVVPSPDSNAANFTSSNVDPTSYGDQPRPLTDAEWAGHLIEVREGLTQAEGKGLTPERMYTINGAGEIWTDERELLHQSILEKLYSEAANVPCAFKAIIAGGLGGAGKTTVLTEHANIDLSQYLMINPDIFKGELARRGMIPEVEGLSPMEASDLVHEESSYLALQLALRAKSDGKNVIWDITMSTKNSTEGRIDDLRSAGYTQVDGLFVDIPVETSVRRIESRHREGHELYRSGESLGGRYVPAEVIERQLDPEWGSKNRRTFEALKEKFTRWAIYDNSVDWTPPRLIETSIKRQER